jgi:hypothetical protein
LIHIAGILREPVMESVLQRSLNEEKRAIDVFASFTRLHLNETNFLETENEL